MQLKGAVTAITGASRGLGRELALALAREGCHLRVCARNKALLQSLAVEVAGLGVDYQAFPLALTGAGASFETVISTERVDILINNAGMAHPMKPLDAFIIAELYELIELNLLAPVALMQAVIPGMNNRGQGVIVNICSMAGRRAIKNLSVYCGSKFALRGITEAVAQELEGSGVSCFSVSPGGMNTQTRSDLFGVANAQRQQEPAVVAAYIVQALAGRLEVPNGADLVVRDGEAWVILPELWELGAIIPAIRRVIHNRSRKGAVG